ncbi:MAG: FAD-binding oxidoreductase [Candidatus Hodarchaeota archaeon]
MELLDLLSKIVGKENVSDNELDLICYANDLAPLPDIVLSAYKLKPPSYIVRPNNAKQVSDIVKLANDRKIPVTPRGGASSGLGGCIPVEGGIVLDLTSLDRVVDINQKEMALRVQSGVVWKTLVHKSERARLKPGIYPSSAPSATVGGFISTGGCAGIGAPKYGPIFDQIIELEVVLPNGDIVRLSPPLSNLFVGAEGTLGVVTEAILKAYPLPKAFSVSAYAFKETSSACDSIAQIHHSGLKPYYLFIVDKYLLDTTRSLGIEMPECEMLVVVAFEGAESEIEMYRKAFDKTFSIKGEKLESGIAEDEWERRYNAELFVKRAGPTLILLELNLPIRSLFKAATKLKEMERRGLKSGLFGILGHGGSMLVMPVLLTDERSGSEYLRLLLSVRDIVKSSFQFGGTIYGVGLHNSMYMDLIHDSKILDLMKSIKKKFDPNGIMNIGKMTECRVPPVLRGS